MINGFFSLIQFSPDVARCEAVNIGVLLISEEIGFLDLRMTDDFSRVHRLLPPANVFIDQEFFESAKQSFSDLVARRRNELMNIEGMRHFGKTLPHEIRLSEPKPIKITNAVQDLDDLFATLVIVSNKAARKSTEILFPEFDRKLRGFEFVNKITFDFSTEVPITGKVFSAPYAYRNGHTNIIKPQKIADITMAEALAAEGDILQKETENKLIVLPKVTIRKPDAVKQVESLFQFFNIQCFSENQFDDLFEKIDHEAHAL